MLKALSSVVICLCFLFGTPSALSKDFSDSVSHQPTVLTANHIGVVYNRDDPNSVEVARYYAKARQIPSQNLIAVRLPVKGDSNMDTLAFQKLQSTIAQYASPDIQVLLLVWQTPYKVNKCQSITSAITLGLSEQVCGCKTGEQSPYFNNTSRLPYTDLKIRPSMLLPSDSVTLAKEVIDRGVLSEFRINEATGYFLRTSDAARSKPREPFFPPEFSTIQSRKLRMRSPKQDAIQHKQDIMFYFTGLERVPHLETLTFLPGAIADHLTSVGGIIDQAPQMPATAWLKAGATGSYGTVTEPCNFWQKFPNPQVVLTHYLAGETLIESYWKSVAWPQQGLFIGEPLAAPYRAIQ